MVKGHALHRHSFWHKTELSAHLLARCQLDAYTYYAYTALDAYTYCAYTAPMLIYTNVDYASYHWSACRYVYTNANRNANANANTNVNTNINIKTLMVIYDKNLGTRCHTNYI